MKKQNLFILLFLLGIVFNINTVNAAETVKEFNVEMNVEESGVINVVQKMKVDFTQKKHGIYVTIPEKYNMNWDGNKKNYFFPVTDVKVKNHEYSVDHEDEGTIIRIGDEDSYVNGLTDYEFSYKVRTKDLDLNGAQMLYYNIVGDKWDFNIENVSYKITMPKEFNRFPVVYDPSGPISKDLIKVEGNVISGSYGALDQGEAITIKLNLPNDYFTFPSTDNIQKISLIVTGLITAVIVVVFMRYGRDKKVIQSIQFKPPKGMSSAQVGYVVDGSLQSKDLTSLIVYWASKEYMIITEVDKKVFEFEKIKDLDESELAIEKVVFDSLFSEGNKVRTDDIPEEYSKNIFALRVDMADYYKKDKAIFKTKSSVFQVLLGLLISINIAVLPAIYFYLDSYRTSMFFVGLLLFGIPAIIMVVLITYTLTNRKLRSKFKNLSLSFITIILAIVFSFVYLAAVIMAKPNALTVILSLASFFVSSVFIAFMSARTDYGHNLLEEILGFRDFIVYAEKERLEMFVKETPSFFYDILPYAYVLGVSDKWIKNFENIQMAQPTWYVSDYPITSLYFMNNLTNSISYMNTVSAIGNVEAGSGGFSGGGGGGFSGGGFGGGGGGSW